MFAEDNLKVDKSGAEVKSAITARLDDLHERLSKRDAELEEVMSDRARLRSYLTRNQERDNYYRGSQVRVEIPTEDHQRITELCTRIHLIQTEIDKLSLIRESTRDDQAFSLAYQDLIELGFRPPEHT